MNRCLIMTRAQASGSVAVTRRVSCTEAIRTIGCLLKTLNPAVARVLKPLYYPLDVILTCVRWYVAYPLSLRHLEEMMAERGISVDHSTVHRWAIKRRTRPMLGFSNFRCARILLSSIELMHMIANGQMENRGIACTRARPFHSLTA